MPDTPDIPEELPPSDEAVCAPEEDSTEAPAPQEIAESVPKEAAESAAPAAAEIAASGNLEESKNEKKQETPVLDVHAPHGGVHTWKDFWIHLGTIAVGLLIAIGLEQSVEKLHQLHQRHELEAALQAEAEHNRNVAEVNFSGYDEEMTWLLGLHEDIGRMLATGGKANLPYRPVHYRSQFANGERFISTGEVFETVVWDTADEDNRLVLLPDQEARAYSSHFHYTGARFLELQIAIRDAFVRQDAFESEFADSDRPTTPVLAKMSPADLKQYDALVMQTFTAVRIAKGWLVALYGSNEALRQGLFDSASTTYAMAEAAGRFKNDYRKMDQRIAEEDAVRDKAAAKPAEKSGR